MTADRASGNQSSIPPLSQGAAALWTLALLTAEHLCIALCDALRPGALTDIVSLTTCEVLATSLAVFAYARMRAPDASLRALIGLRPLSVHHGFLALLCGVGLAPVLSRLDELVLARFPYEDPEALAAMQKLITHSPRVLLVVGVFVVIPAVRDLFFRGLLFEGLVPRSPFRTVALTALLFAASSLDPRSWPSALLLGLALGWLRLQSGSVVAAMLGHLAFWSLEGAAILRGQDPSIDVTYAPAWVAAGGATAAAALALARWAPFTAKRES